MKTIPYHKHVKASQKTNPQKPEIFSFRVNQTKDGATVKVGIGEDCQKIKVICLKPIGENTQTILEFSLGQSGAAALIDGLVTCLKKAEAEGNLNL